jgi:hypothetical protein
MKLPRTEKELTELFRKLGAQDPESWASSQLQEGIPQLQRFLWLREAWKLIVPDDNYDWMAAEIKRAETSPNDPYSGVGLALKQCLERGIDKEALNEIVRGKQAEFLFALCYMLEDPNLPEKEVKNLCWGLFETDEEGNPVGPIGGLHESVLETDPTGREMRPKNRT